MTISIVRETHAHDDFKQLIQLLDTGLHNRYGTLQETYEQYNVIESLDTIAIAYVGQNPAGCGAFKPYENEMVEIKRMYVKPEYRGMGIGSSILYELETWALELEFSKVILETGKKQGEAIGLYRKNGYRQIENYGQYREQPNSVCFQKFLERVF